MAKMKIAITGGIGSGKSLALQFISQMGYPVFSCDEIYKEVIQSPRYIEQVEALFPEVILNGCIVRERLSRVVFNNSKNREKLNAIAHPLIMDCLNAQMNQCENELVFAEVPLLFEGNFEKQFDQIIYIYRDKESRIKNVILRDGLTKEDVEKRMTVQFNPDSSDGKKRLLENEVLLIENNDSKETLYQKLSTTILNMKH